MSIETRSVADVVAVGFFKFVGYAVGVTALSLFSSWAFSLIWQWFVVPMGAPHIGIAQAWGVATVIEWGNLSVLTRLVVDHDDSKKAKIIVGLLAGLFIRGLILLECWVVRHYFM